jgi:triphosphoribosyl-dephospho-CoA synthase
MIRDDDAGALSRIVAAAQLACLLEATAAKPGNVSPGRGFADATYEDYLASAAAIGGPFAGVGDRPLGRTVRLAVEATWRWTHSNTNLGIVLLLAPLARASLVAGRDGDVRAAIRHVLERTTVDDAREVYAAIRRAAPGGLGRVDEQDVSGEPDRTLLEVMRLATDRDGIAREYATGFQTTFEIAVPALQRARTDGLSWSDRMVETFLTLLAVRPDTHVVRRSGTALAAEVSRRAEAALDAGGVRSAAGRCAIEEMDRALRDPRHAANPGTTADLTAAAAFVVLVGSGEGDTHAAAR